MSRIVVVTVLAGLCSAGLWRSGRSLFAAPQLLRRNVRGVDVPVAVGALAVLGATGAAAILGLLDSLRNQDGTQVAGRGSLAAVLAVAGTFAVLGLIDDLVGDHAEKGFRGHLRALVHGRLTTGGLKLVGGGLVALGASGYFHFTPGRIVVGAAVVALSANTANLFDRAPGRLTKVAVVALVVLVATVPAAERSSLLGPAAVVGGALGLLWPDLREELMLGDAGANPVGAALGWGVMVTGAWSTQLLVLAVLVVVNVVGERVSFSTVIDRTRPLRSLDRLGRKPL